MAYTDETLEPDAVARGSVVLLHPRDTRPHAPAYQELLDVLTRSAVTALAGAGYDVSLYAAAGRTVDEALAAARAADAVVLLGGEDVDPTLYGGPVEYPGSGMHEPEADRVAVEVIRDAVARRAPLLGICRGHQLLNVALGGTLVPDMTGHRGAGGDHYVRTTVAAEDPAIADVLAASPALCTHHQAVAALGEGLRVLARAADGTVEAIAHVHAPVLGVQWHPEHPVTAAAQLPVILDRLRAGIAEPAH